MVITEERLNSWLIIILKGKFVIKNLAEIRMHFDNAALADRPAVALDMSEVSQLDSSAITILVNFQRHIIQKDGLLVLYGMSNDITEIFSIVGIDKIFRICSSRQDFKEIYGDQDT